MAHEEESIDWSNIKTVHEEQIEEKPRTNFDLENLHPEARRRLQMLGFVKLDENGIHQEVSDEEIDTILLKRRHLEDPDLLADRYMMKHGVYEIFKTLTTKIVLDRPNDPVTFIINDLEKRTKSHPKL